MSLSRVLTSCTQFGQMPRGRLIREGPRPRKAWVEIAHLGKGAHGPSENGRCETLWHVNRKFSFYPNMLLWKITNIEQNGKNFTVNAWIFTNWILPRASYCTYFILHLGFALCSHQPTVLLGYISEQIADITTLPLNTCACNQSSLFVHTLFFWRDKIYFPGNTKISSVHLLSSDRGIHPDNQSNRQDTEQDHHPERSLMPHSSQTHSLPYTPCCGFQS